MATSDDLLQDVYANFLSAYDRNQTASNANVLAFEAIGLAPGLSAGAPNSPALAVEYVSTLADALPDLSGGVYARTMRTISVSYANMLSVAEPSTQAGAPTFNAMKASANEALDNSSLGSEEGPTTFKPVYALPAGWYDPSQPASWTAYSYNAGTSSTAASSPTTPNPAPRVPMRPIMRTAPWRLMVAAPAGHAASIPANALQRPVYQFSSRIPLVPANPATSAPPALHPSFAMSFEYCIVELNRPWFSGDFLASAGWYVPGAHQGDYASGPVATTSASSPAPAPSGSFAYVPTAFIAIKNLSINAAALEGGAPDAGQPMAFGPFSLANATGSSDALTAPGIQIIAWICSVQPQLPPATDPALIPAAASNAATTVNTVTSDVGAVKGLLGELKGL
jgi:hypothetical protein